MSRLSRDEFIKPFFATVHLVMAGNDTEGLRYATTEIEEEYYLTWKEPGLETENRLDRHLLQLSAKSRLLEIVHDFIGKKASSLRRVCRGPRVAAFDGEEAQ